MCQYGPIEYSRIKFCRKFVGAKSRNFTPKILEGGTKDEIRSFEELFKGVRTRFGLRTIEKSIENPDFIFCSSFQNRCLGSINCFCSMRGSCEFERHIDMRGSCEFDRHIDMRDSCEFDRHIDMLSSSCEF